MVRIKIYVDCCTNFLCCRGWAKTEERRKKDKEALKQKQKLEEKEKKDRDAKVALTAEMGDEEIREEKQDAAEDDYTPDMEKAEEEGKRKQKKFEVTFGASKGDLPQHWNHLRESPHKVRPEFYRVVDSLVAQYHCSVDQAVAGVVLVGRGLFGLPWKFHEEGSTLDLDTAPHKQSQLLASRAIEAHTLSKIAQLIVDSPANATVTLHDDGSRAQGCGGYSVSGVTLPGREPGTKQYFPFPTLPIAKESRVNLAELKLTILAILATYETKYLVQD